MSERAGLTRLTGNGIGECGQGDCPNVYRAEKGPCRHIPYREAMTPRGLEVALLKPPHPDASLDPFRDGVGALIRDGEVVGHVATTVSESWSPGTPLRRQW